MNAQAPFLKAVEAAGIFPKNGPDPSARSWSHDESGVTFAAQHRLPRWRVPSLEASCGRYLKALKPLQSEEEHESSVVAVQAFLEGEGPVLQAQLEAYEASHANFFEHFCYESFLADESSVVLNSNAFCVFKDDRDPSRNDQITRATSLVRSALAFSNAIREDTLQPDHIRGTPVCMNQYWWLFGAARIPSEDGGRLRLDPDASHIVVCCRGQIYRLDVLNKHSGEIISEKQLATGLASVVDDAERLSDQDIAHTSVGLLTTENQKVWSRHRQLLVRQSPRNGKNLSAIDSSLFVLCLDDNLPSNKVDVCKNMISGTDASRKGVQVGTCLNRWYDKLSIIVCRNGVAGMNFEHTCSDGSVDIRMACDIYQGSLAQNNSGRMIPDKISFGNSYSTFGADGENEGKRPVLASKLEWDIPPDTEHALYQALDQLSHRIHKHQLETLDIVDFGKAWITSVGFSPDAFFQLALQAAYYTMYGRVRSGFEPVSTRNFLHGRTDVVRTTTPEAAAFARLFCDDEAGVEEKVQAMRRAAEAHVALCRDCTNGLSHHRHLFVLHQMWKRRHAFFSISGLDPLETGEGNTCGAEQHEDHTVFTDPGWARLGTTILMGSNVENPCLAYAGFGPPADEGFTICYFIRQDHMAMSVCTRNGEANRFVETLEQTFQQLKRLLERSKSTCCS